MHAPCFLRGACAAWLTLGAGCFYLDHESETITRTTRESLDEPRLEVTPKLVELSGDRLRIEAPCERIERYEERSSSESESNFEFVMQSATVDLIDDSEEGDELWVLICMPFTLAWDLLLPITGTLYNLGDAVLSSGSSDYFETHEGTDRTAVALPAVALVDPATGASTALAGESGSWELGLEELASAGFRGPALELRGADEQRLLVELSTATATRLQELASQLEPLPDGERIEVQAGADLRHVLANARAGSVVVLAAGSYEIAGKVALERPLTLCGAGTLRTELRGVAEDAHFGLGAPTGSAGIVLRDLSVVRGSSAARALLEIQGPARIARCRILGAETSSGAGIAATGSADVAIEKCRFALHPSGALLWSGNARGSVTDNVFARCGSAVSVREQACPVLETNRFEDVPTPIFAEWAEAR